MSTNAKTLWRLFELTLAWIGIGVVLLFFTFPFWGMSTHPFITPPMFGLAALLWFGSYVLAAKRLIQARKRD
jgi:hypothetical protein